MSKNHIEKIAIIGAGGNIGKYFTLALLATGKSVTAITRVDSKNTLPAGVSVAKVDYGDESSLVDALKGHDALIITLSVFAPPNSQTHLINAAVAAGVPWVMPNFYSSDQDKKELQEDIKLGLIHEEVQKYIESKAGISWIGLASSFWYEHSLALSWAYGFDVDKKEVTFYDDGETKINTSTWPLCGLAVAKVFSLPIHGDEPLTLDHFRNKYVYVSSFFVNQKDIFASLLRVTGTTEVDWKIGYEESKTRFEDGQKELAAGNRAGFGKLLYARMFYKDGSGDIRAKLHNEVLGLPKENLDEFTKKAIELHESGYGAYGRG